MDVRLGWANPLTNALTGQDAPNLRLLFTSLSHWLQFPLVGLARADQIVPSHTLTDISWSTQTYDEYQLWDSGTTIRVPPAFRTYLMIGAVGVLWANGAAVQRETIWRVNGVQLPYKQDSSGGAARQSVPVMQMMRRGSTVTVAVYHEVGADTEVDFAEVWCLFLPMGPGEG